MLNKLNSLRNREDGFTLIELLIVVIIIGILAAIALPIFLNQQRAAHEAAVVSDVRNTVGQVEVAKFNGGGTFAAADVTPTQSTGDVVTVTPAANGSDYTIVGTGAGTRANFHANYDSTVGKVTSGVN